MPYLKRLLDTCYKSTNSDFKKQQFVLQCLLLCVNKHKDSANYSYNIIKPIKILPK